MAKRRKPTPAEVRAIRRMIDHGPKSVWLTRWRAAVPHAIARYRVAVLERAEAMVDKYAQSIKRFKINDRPQSSPYLAGSETRVDKAQTCKFLNLQNLAISKTPAKSAPTTH